MFLNAGPRRGLSKPQERKLLEFLENHAPFDRKVTICAQRRSNGYLMVDVAGAVDSGTRQRIRNFMITLL